MAASRPRDLLARIVLAKILLIVATAATITFTSGRVAGAQQVTQRFAEFVPAAQDTARVHAVDYGEAYYTRLAIHRVGSYTMLPLFGAEFFLGEKLIKGGAVAAWIKPTHIAVASAIGGLFVVNTVTGALNLYSARRDPENRTRRYAHAALMLAAEAGFAYTGTLAGEASDGRAAAHRHRNAALTSIGISTAGATFMWLSGD